MSETEKQKLNDAMTWIMRGLTALGGLFFIRTFDVMNDTNELLQTHLRQYASDRVEFQIRLGVAERELERNRNEREQRKNYQYQTQGDERN
jgi:hypothetical protein